jgi:PAS domain S-box-containing protein
VSAFRRNHTSAQDAGRRPLGSDRRLARLTRSRRASRVIRLPVSLLQSTRIDDVLAHVNVPSYVIDAAGVIRWLNPAAKRIVGDVEGRQFTSVVAPEQTRRARQLFARKVVGAATVTDAGFVLVDSDGDRVAVEISSVPLHRGEHVVGVFGQVTDLVETPHAHPELPLTPRQAEVLDLLERGRTTRQIAAELHLSIDTVRNHIRHILHAVGAHSRLEAVAIAHGAH